jgi:hypothetical protein
MKVPADDTASADFQKFAATYDGAGGRALAELIRASPPNPQRAEGIPTCAIYWRWKLAHSQRSESCKAGRFLLNGFANRDSKSAT